MASVIHPAICAQANLLPELQVLGCGDVAAARATDAHDRRQRRQCAVAEVGLRNRHQGRHQDTCCRFAEATGDIADPGAGPQRHRTGDQRIAARSSQRTK